MASVAGLPTSKDIRDMLETLLGREVRVEAGDPLATGPGKVRMEAVYVDERLRTAAVVVTDLALAAFMAAAIGLVPKRGAESAVKDRALGAVLHENADEVFNVMSALFNQGDASHLRLYATYPPERAARPDVMALSGTYGRRLDLEVDIARYGKGRLAVVLT